MIQAIFWMREAGLIDEWKLRTWMRMKAEFQHEQIDLDNMKTFQALNLDDVQGVFILYILFVVASIVTFILEVMCWRGNQYVS